jgi:hypothetical protein
MQVDELIVFPNYPVWTVIHAFSASQFGVEHAIYRIPGPKGPSFIVFKDIQLANAFISGLDDPSAFKTHSIHSASDLVNMADFLRTAGYKHAVINFSHESTERRYYDIDEFIRLGTPQPKQ